ncbi:hypothetical protein [Actinomadura hibisca]|uniref:hypothetical protein n=1 Tax=Actinomadura hibisca TaxID=68565 RepID=UPI000834AABF|nr:hypothetical protein [Actinomadura hibisca]
MVIFSAFVGMTDDVGPPVAGAQTNIGGWRTGESVVGNGRRVVAVDLAEPFDELVFLGRL